MGMAFLETADGGRIAKGGTLWGHYLVEWDAKGRIVQSRMIPKHPSEAHPEPSLLHQQPQPHRLARPGDWLRALIYVATFGLARYCLSCGQRREVLNRAGWLGLPRLVVSAVGRLVI